MVFQFIATPSAELEYVSDRDAGFKQPLESCKLLTRWAFEYFDQTTFCCSWFSQPARSETRKICGETNGLITSIVTEITYASCPKTQTNSRLARRDVSDQRRLRLGWPMEARILGHEKAEPALDIVGRRHPWLDPA